jgi:hypothetical protein
MGHDFTVVLRGYDRPSVDAAIKTAEDALDSGSELARAAARDALADPGFLIRMRGYHRVQVDQHLNALLQALDQAR